MRPLLKNGKVDLIQGTVMVAVGISYHAVGFYSREERLGSTANTTRKSRNFEPRSMVVGGGVSVDTKLLKANNWRGDSS